MSSSSQPQPQSRRPQTSVADFQLLFDNLSLRPGGARVLALCGAGLSASSGLPTFRGAGGLWRRHQATSLATPEAFAADPGLVWLFYAWRRHMALSVQPNAGHVTLARLARRLGGSISNSAPAAAATDPAAIVAAAVAAAAAASATAEEQEGQEGARKGGFLCLTQNVDGLSARAGHPPAQLRELHGSLFDLLCEDREGCGYVERGNMDDPLCEALAPASEANPDWLADPDLPAPSVRAEDLPSCPDCGAGTLLRPGVVWFGEFLDDDMLVEADQWIAGGVDVMLVVGTAAVVYPAAGYVQKAKRHGARVVVLNTDPDADEGLGPEDFFFQGDAADFLPRLFENVLGPIGTDKGA